MTDSNMSLTDKKKVLKNLVTATQKKYGGSVHSLSFAKDRMKDLKIEFIPTPSEKLNDALAGGFAKGRIIEIAGEPSSGKTSLMLETIALDMKHDPEAVWGWYETEGDFDPDYAFNIKGIDPDRLILWEMSDDGAENGLDTLEMLIRSNTMKGIVTNSVAGLTPSKELESQMDDQQVALQARMMSKLMRKIVAITSKTKTLAVFINQTRTNIGQKYGNPNITTGGKALRFFGSQSVHLNKVKLEDSDGIKAADGMRISARVIKNRCAQGDPYKATSFVAIYGEGIDFVGELIELSLDKGLATMGGSWVYFPNKENVESWSGTELRFQGKAKCLDFIRQNTDFQDHIREQLKGNLGVKSLSPEEIAEIEAEEAALESEIEAGGDKE